MIFSCVGWAKKNNDRFADFFSIKQFGIMQNSFHDMQEMTQFLPFKQQHQHGIRHWKLYRIFETLEFFRIRIRSRIFGPPFSAVQNDVSKSNGILPTEFLAKHSNCGFAHRPSERRSTVSCDSEMVSALGSTRRRPPPLIRHSAFITTSKTD